MGCHRLSQRARGWLAPNQALLFLICVLLSPPRALLHPSTQTPRQLESLNLQQRGKDRALPSASLPSRNGNWPTCPQPQSREAWTKDTRGSPNNHWTFSLMTAPWTILWMTCTVHGYMKTQPQDMYLTTTICPALSFAVWGRLEVPLKIMAVSCDTLYISIVKQSPCPEEFEIWRDKSVMIKHVKSNHHPASPHVPLLIPLSRPQKEQSLQPRTIFVWQPLACVNNAV